MALHNNYDEIITSTGVTWDDTGIVEGSLSFRIGRSSAVSTALSYTSHPDHAFLKRSGGSVTFLAGGYADVSLSFIGVDPDMDGQVTTNIRATMATEPIDTHPTFKEWSPPFEPIFDLDGTFKQFPPLLKAGGKNEKGGIQSYLDPTVTYEQSKIFAKASKKKLASELKNIGYIDDGFWTGAGIPKAPSPVGQDGKPRNWLLCSGSYDTIGDGGKVSKSWRLSGRRGWDELIYKK